MGEAPVPSSGGEGPDRAGNVHLRRKDLERRAARCDHSGRDDIGAGVRRGALSWLLVMGCLFASFPALAQEHPSDEHGEEHFHPNEAAFLLGATFEAESRDNLFTVGGEYARRLTPRLTAGAGFEHLSDVGAWVYVFPVGFRVFRGLTFSLAPGFEHISRRRGGEGERHGVAPEVTTVATDGGADNLFLFRIGAGYAFELGERYSITAGVAYDWINEERTIETAVVYGVKLGIGF